MFALLNLQPARLLCCVLGAFFRRCCYTASALFSAKVIVCNVPFFCFQMLQIVILPILHLAIALCRAHTINHLVVPVVGVGWLGTPLAQLMILTIGFGTITTLTP